MNQPTEALPATSPATARRYRDAERVLVYRLGSLGDTLVALPSFHLVARAFPGRQQGTSRGGHPRGQWPDPRVSPLFSGNAQPARAARALVADRWLAADGSGLPWRCPGRLLGPEG